MQKFLNFVVENTLIGNPDRLKETIVGIEVFDREPGYDPKSDSIVRTEAHRLRSKLEQYYATAGAHDDIIIRIHKGSYIPVFETSKNKLVSFSTLTDPEPPSESASVAPPPPTTHNRRELALGIAIVSSLLVLAGWYFFFRSSSLPVMRVTPLTGNAGVEISPALSPNGRQIAYAWKKEGGEFDIYIKLIDLGEPVRLTSNSGHNVSPSWSPDGERIAFLRATPSQTEIIVMPALGGSERVIFQFEGGFDQWQSYGPKNWGKSGPVWTKDGKAVIVCDAWTDVNCGLIRVDLNGARTRLTSPDRGELDFSPAVSPDGKFIAFTRGIPGAGDLYTMPVSGGTPRRVTYDRVDISGVSWWNADTLLFGSLRGGIMSVWQIKTSGREPTIVSMAASPGGEDPSAAASQNLIAYVNSVEQQSIWRRSLAVTAPQLPAERFISSAGRDNSPKYSPNGTRIAFVSDRSGSWQIWICNSDASHATRLTSFESVPVGSPEWSPDGRLLAFDAKVGRYSEIWLLDVTSGIAPWRLNQTNTEDVIPTWSRDGKWIYFISDRTGHNHLWKQKIDGGSAVLVSNDTALDATESVDGKYLYYEKPGDSIWHMPKDGGAATPIPQLIDFRTARNWAVTSSGIYFASHTAKPPVLGFLHFGTPAIIDLGRMQGDTVNGTPSLAVSPDQRWLLYAQQESRRSNIMVARKARSR